MSKAEEKALEAYPVLFSERNGYDNTFKDRRESYIKGYQQAEKDLELTWEGISIIRQIMFDYNRTIRNEMAIPNDEEYCQEVLKRFKDFEERKEKCQ